MMAGYNVRGTEREQIEENYAFDRFEDGSQFISSEYEKRIHLDNQKNDHHLDTNMGDKLLKSVISDGPMDSPWPQQGYNAQHVGRSPYSTEDNPGIEKWRFPAGDWCWGSPSIGPDGTIYFGSSDNYLYAVYPNGTLKWKFEAERSIGNMGDHPAIADDGTVYFGTRYGSWIQAVNPDGSAKWAFETIRIHTSITLGPDGMVYYGGEWGIEARYPNGTIYWDALCRLCAIDTSC